MQVHRLLLSSFLFFTLIFVGVGCGGQKVTVKPITLTYWRYDAPAEALSTAITTYRAEHPNVTVEVQTFTREEYEQKLLEAFAEDRGPDMFSVPNVWLHRWQQQVLPMPGETIVPTPVVTNGKASAILKTTASPGLRDISNSYVDVVVDDILLTIPATEDAPAATAVLGLPFSADTLALFANTDLLADAGATEAPKTWQEFSALAAKLTLRRGTALTLSGAALGTARNVTHATDILSALMLQNGTTMTDERGFVRFNEPERTTRAVPAVDALLFYKDFANPASSAYSWNENMPSSLDAFVTGKAAFFFGYPHDADVIRERSPRLRFTISALPQVSLARPVSVAQYPIEVISKKTTHPNEAWDFLLFATKPEQVGAYLAATRRPPALRGLLAGAVANPEVAPFASQVLTAQAWYKGNDYSVVEEGFAELIETPVEETRDIRSLMDVVVGRINQTIR